MNYDENQMDDITQVLTDAGWTVKEGHNNLGYYDSSSEGSFYDNAMYKLAKSIQAIYKDSKTGYYYEINVIPEIYWTYFAFQYFKTRITFVKNVHPSFGFYD